MLTDYHVHLRPDDDPDWPASRAFTSENAERYRTVAAERGVEELGVAEHVYRFQQTLTVWQHPFWRERATDDLDSYAEFVKDRTDLKLGIEADFVAGHEDKMANLLERYDWDFVVGSIHFLRDEALDVKGEFDIWRSNDPDKVWKRYFARSKTPCRDCTSLDQADTIIDSMMNAPLLVWGGHRDLALRHADGVARHLVRANGSTAQSVHFDRRDGRVLIVHTHQGLNDRSTWARGQGWGLYGFTGTALATGEPRLLDVAERLAGYVRARNPRGEVPRYDYDAPAGAPTDTSAGVITAAGLLRLERACRRMRRCAGRGKAYGDLGERMLDSSLEEVRAKPPLGMLGGQVHSLGGSQEWDDSGEFIFGLDFALEAVSLASRR